MLSKSDSTLPTDHNGLLIGYLFAKQTVDKSFIFPVYTIMKVLSSK